MLYHSFSGELFLLDQQRERLLALRLPLLRDGNQDQQAGPPGSAVYPTPAELFRVQRNEQTLAYGAFLRDHSVLTFFQLLPEGSSPAPGEATVSWGALVLRVRCVHLELPSGLQLKAVSQTAQDSLEDQDFHFLLQCHKDGQSPSTQLLTLRFLQDVRETTLLSLRELQIQGNGSFSPWRAPMDGLSPSAALYSGPAFGTSLVLAVPQPVFRHTVPLGLLEWKQGGEAGSLAFCIEYTAEEEGSPRLRPHGVQVSEDASPQTALRELRKAAGQSVRREVYTWWTGRGGGGEGLVCVQSFPKYIRVWVVEWERSELDWESLKTGARHRRCWFRNWILLGDESSGTEAAAVSPVVGMQELWDGRLLLCQENGVLRLLELSLERLQSEWEEELERLESSGEGSSASSSSTPSSPSPDTDGAVDASQESETETPSSDRKEKDDDEGDGDADDLPLSDGGGDIGGGGGFGGGGFGGEGSGGGSGSGGGGGAGSGGGGSGNATFRGAGFNQKEDEDDRPPDDAGRSVELIYVLFSLHCR